MRKFLPAALAACAFVATPVSAQQAGLVNVEIGDVTILNDFLNDTQIAALNNISAPITVQMPIGIAANACGVNANVLAQQAQDGTAECDATSGSQALAQSVNRQLLRQTR